MTLITWLLEKNGLWCSTVHLTYTTTSGIINNNKGETKCYTQ